MKSGCLFSLLAWGVGGAVAYSIFDPRFTQPGDWIGAIISGFITMCAFGMLQSAAKALREGRLIKELASPEGFNASMRDDDKLTAVAGTLRATAGALRAPISGRDAVLYEYEISHIRGSGKNQSKVKDFSGVVLNPTVIDSPYGPVQLLGFPKLEGWKKESLKNPEHYDNARIHIASTEWVEMSGLNFGKMYEEVKSYLEDNDGIIAKHFRMTDDLEIDGSYTLQEESAGPGEQVCAIGLYSAQKGGLIPDRARGYENRLVRGTPHEAIGRVRKRAIGYVIGALIFGSLGNGAVYGVLTVREREIQARAATEIRESWSKGHARDIASLGARSVDLPPPPRRTRT